MNSQYKKNLISKNSTIIQALDKLNKIDEIDGLTLFVLNENNKLIGTITDGDIRRSLLKGIKINEKINKAFQKNFKHLVNTEVNIEKLEFFRKLDIKLLPILDSNGSLVEIVNLKVQKSYLPIKSVIMAGGRGKRLQKLTINTPKPLLKINKKPIIQYNIERLVKFGIKDITLSVNYLKEQLIETFKDGSSLSANIQYLHEKNPLGTAGALSKLKSLTNSYILLMNSDLLTNIDFEDFFKNFIENNADMAVATIPYSVKVPYAILNTNENIVTSFMEKPTFNYFSNAGIYLMKKSVIDLVPDNHFFDATDLMNKVIKSNKKLISYPILGYWLDIGKPEDFEKAKIDVKKIKF